MASRLAAAVLGVIALAGGRAAADPLDSVRAGGTLRCATNGATADYTRFDTHGDVTDLAAEICKAVAIAVAGPTAAADVHVWPDEQHMLQSLRAGTADLAIGAAPTVGLATGFDVGFAPPIFYDGVGFLARREVETVADLADKQVCFLPDANLPERLQAAMRTRHVALRPFVFEETGEMQAAAAAGHCAAISGNVSQLINLRVGFGGIEKRFHLLPEMLTKDPVSPAFRAEDRRWGRVVDAVVTLLIQAEESGITSANAERLRTTEDPFIQQLIGARADVGRMLGLRDDWALMVLTRVGNYGEIFERTLGAESGFKLPRGANRPWSQGGVMYAMPLF